MSNTNDFVIDNNTGQAVRLDIEDAFQQLATNNAGDNKPTTPYNHQWFANEASGKLTFKDATSGNLDANYFNLAKLTGGLYVDQPSDFNGDVVFHGTHSNGLYNIKFDADNTNGFGAFVFYDNSRAIFGAGEDFVIAHSMGINLLTSATDSVTWIQTRKHPSFEYNLRITTRRSDDSGDDPAYDAIRDGGQLLYFDGSKKCETTANGITVQGAVTTQDINMSNLSSLPNEVDNTQGSWSIQEGADDLFLINRVSGKKYKFNLTEVT